MGDPLVRPTVTYFAERGSRDGTSPIENVGRDATAASRKFFVPWAERFDAVKALIGYSELQGSVGTTPPYTMMRRLTPLQHPDRSNWYATKVTNIKGHKFTTKRVGSDSSIANQFAKAEIEVQYENVPYRVIPDSATTIPGTEEPFTWPDDEYRRYVSRGEARISTDYIQLPGGLIAYSTSDSLLPHGRTIPFNVGTVLPIVEWPFMWHGVPYKMIDDVESATGWWKKILGLGGTGMTLPYIGSVNKTEIWNCKPGTLLLSNVRPIPKYSDWLDWDWDIEFTFALDPRGWNYKMFVPIKGEAEWHLVTRKNSDGTTPYYAAGSIPDKKSLYNEREFRKLFQVAVA